MADENPFLGPQSSSDPENPFLGPGVDSQLASSRQDHAKQLESDPQTAIDLFKLTHNEVGSQGPEATQAFLETVFNRSKARGQTIAETINDKNYYPKASFREVPLKEDIDTSNYTNALNNVIKGGNISGFATGNASGSVGFGGGQQTAQFGGEKFGIEGPDLKGVKVPTNPFSGPARESYEAYIPETLNTEAEAKLAEQLGNDHPVFKNAIEAASEVITGLVPKSPFEYAKVLLPNLMAFDQAKRVISSDQPLNELVSQIPLVARIPEIRDAERTPPGSKERFAAGFRTINDILMIAGLGKAAGIKGKVGVVKPSTAEITIPVASTQEIPIQQPFSGTEIPNPVPGSGKFRKSYQIDKELGDRMEGIGSAHESGALRAEDASYRLLNELTPEQEADFGRYLVSRRLRTVNPDHPQILSDQEMLSIESDPSIANALKTYVGEIKPNIEALRKRAGLTETAAAGKEPEFISLIPKTEELLNEPTGAARASRVSRTTRYARHAAGLAKEYDTDLRNVLRESYSEATRKARLADFYQAAKRKGLTETDKFEDLPGDLARDLNEIIGPKSQVSGPLKTVRAIQRGATGAALTANPPEVVNHMRRQLNLLAAKPPVGRGVLARLEWLLPYIGPKTGAFVRVLSDDMSTAVNRGVLQDIFDSGGGSSRSFSEMYKLRGKIAKYTGLQWLQAKTHNLLFGVPRGRGVVGWDLRMRVQLEKIRREVEGNTDPHRIREFSNQIGQYGSHPDWIIGALREINPYTATSLPMRLTELKTAFGGSGLKAGAAKRMLYRAETLLRGTGGTVLALATANHLLSGRWPWQNDPGHEFDLNTGVTGDDEKRIYLKFRVIAPELSRVVSTLGLPNLSRERTADTPQYASSVMTALANQGLSIVGGPAQNTALTATTGLVPYLVKSPGNKPEFLDVAKTDQGSSRGLEQVKRAAAGLNPLGESLVTSNYEPELPPLLKYIERPIAGFKGVRPLGSMFSQSYEKKGSSRRPTRPKNRRPKRKMVAG